MSLLRVVRGRPWLVLRWWPGGGESAPAPRRLQDDDRPRPDVVLDALRAQRRDGDAVLVPLSTGGFREHVLHLQGVSDEALAPSGDLPHLLSALGWTLAVVGPNGKKPTPTRPSLTVVPEGRLVSDRELAPAALRSVLVVEDDVALRNLATKLLLLAGLSVTTAANGLEGLEALRSRHFDAVLLDVCMPVMDGAEMLERARALSIDVPVVVWTGYASNEQLVRMKELGIDRLLAKPVRGPVLIEAVRAAAGLPAKQGPG